MKTKVPTLSAAGWIGEISEKADSLLSYYFTSEYSQSNVYAGNVVSLQYYIANHSGDLPALKTVLQTSLVNYLDRYFEQVEAEVTTDIPNPDDPNKINITVSVSFMEDGVRYDLGKEIQVANKKVVEIFDLNNNG